MRTVFQESGRETYDSLTYEGYSPFSSGSMTYTCFSTTEEGGDFIAGFALMPGGRLVLIDLERLAFTALAESSFAEDWDSDADSIYDNV